MLDTSTTLNRIVDQLVKITERLDKVSSSAPNTSQYARIADAYKEEYAARTQQPRSKEKVESNSLIKQLRDSMFGKDTPANLSSNEKSRYAQIGKIFKPIFATDSITKAINSLRDSIAESSEQRSREGLFQSVKTKIFGKSDKEKQEEEKIKPQEKDKGFFSSILDVGKKLAGGAALIALGIGLSMLIKSLKDTGSIDTNSIMTFVKVLGVVSVGILALAAGAFAVTKILSNFAGGLLKGALAFGVLAWTLNNQIIPSLDKLKDVKWDEIKGGIASVGAVLGLLVVTMTSVTGGGIKSLLTGGTASWSTMLKQGIGIGMIGALVWIIKEQLVPGLMEISEVKWDQVKGGLAAAGVALGGMTALVGIISKLLGGNVASMGKSILSAVASGGIIYGMIFLLKELGSSMQSFSQFNWNDIETNIQSAGKALLAMTGLTTVIGGIIYGTGGTAALVGAAAEALIAGLSWNLGYLAENITKYNAIDVDKIKAVAENLGPLGIGIGKFITIGGIASLAQVGSGILDKVMGFFGKDIVSSIRAYEKIDASRLEESSKALEKLGNSLQIIYNVFNIIKDIAPKNILDIKVRGSVDAEFIKTVEQLSIKLSDLNKFTGTQIAGGSVNVAEGQKVKLAGISELQQAVEDISRQEIAILGEQLGVLRNAASILAQIRDNTQALENNQSDIPTFNSQDNASGAPTSITRGAFNQGKNVMNMGMRQGTLV